jgi:hypothetical protein
MICEVAAGVKEIILRQFSGSYVKAPFNYISNYSPTVCYSVLKVTAVTYKDNQKNHFAGEELLLLLLGLFSKSPVKCLREITLPRFETGSRDVFSLDVTLQSIPDFYILFVKIHFNIILSSSFT